MLIAISWASTKPFQSDSLSALDRFLNVFYRATRAGTCSRRAPPVAQERNPAAPHARERVPDVQRRSRRSATLPRHTRGNVFQTATPVAQERNPTVPGARERVPDCNAGRAGAQPYRVTRAGTLFQTCAAGRAQPGRVPRLLLSASAL